jgi:hypothetical protein
MILIQLRQILDALESCTPGDYSTGHVIDPSFDETAVNAAIATVTSAISEAEAGDKPVAYLLPNGSIHESRELAETFDGSIALYRTPPTHTAAVQAALEAAKQAVIRTTDGWRNNDAQVALEEAIAAIEALGTKDITRTHGAEAQGAVEPTPMKETKIGRPEPAFRMDAYYYGFEPTGIKIIDLILSAVACAGKSFHHTESWGDDCSEPYHDLLRGKSPVDWIQNAADDAAAAIRAIKPEDVLEGK